MVVDCGSFPVSSIRVYNDGTEWTPTSQSGSKLFFNVSSLGSYAVRTTEGRNLLAWRVVAPQDFTILATRFYPTNGYDNFVQYDNTYIQRAIDTFGHTVYNVAVKPDDESAFSLDVNVVNSEKGNVRYYDGYMLIALTIPTGNQPISVYLGNVLIAYLTRA